MDRYHKGSDGVWRYENYRSFTDKEVKYMKVEKAEKYGGYVAWVLFQDGEKASMDGYVFSSESEAIESAEHWAEQLNTLCVIDKIKDVDE